MLDPITTPFPLRLLAGTPCGRTAKTTGPQPGIPQPYQPPMPGVPQPPSPYGPQPGTQQPVRPPMPGQPPK